jgi:hypothetical protein
MHFRVLLTLLLFSLSLHQACAQVWEWVQTAGSEQNVNYGSALTTDAKGNIYVTGCHHPALHLHKNVETRATISLINEVRRDDRMFVAKYNQRGELLWANHSVGRFVESRAIVTDRLGNVYVSGRFASKTMFGSQDGNNKRLLGYEPGLMFLAKYNPQGNLEWVIKGGSQQGKNSAEALVVEGDRIYMVGYAQRLPGKSLIFHSSDYTRKEFLPIPKVAEEGNMLGCIMVYNSKGKLLSGRFLGGKNAQLYLHDIKMDSRGNYFMSGLFSGNFKIHSKQFIAESKEEEGIIFAFDVDKILQWDMRIEGRFAANSWPRLALLREKLAYSFVCEGKARIFGAHGEPRILGSEASWEQTLYVSQTDLKGYPSWRFSSKAPSGGMGVHDLTFNPQGQLLVTGHYTDELLLGDRLLSSRGKALASGDVNANPATDISDKNLFVTQFTTRGKIQWTMGSENGRYEIPYAITTDAQGQVYATGYFNMAGDVAFGRAPIRALGEVNIFLARIHPDKQDHEIRYPKVPMPMEIAEGTQDVQTRQLMLRQQLTVQSSELDIYLWDNHRLDGDIISLFMGDSCILRNYALQAHHKHIHVKIPTDTTSQLILYAENVGEVSPNTAALAISDGHSRQRVHLQAGLDRSEGLTINYEKYVPDTNISMASAVDYEGGISIVTENTPPGLLSTSNLPYSDGMPSITSVTRVDLFKRWLRRTFSREKKEKDNGQDFRIFRINRNE